MSNGEQASGGKKGLSVLAWVGIGCGCLALLAAALAAVFFLFVAKKVHDVAGDVQRNPALAAARLVVAADPDLEEVEVDEQAGTITVRRKSTGEQLTVDFDDVKEGRLTFQNEQGQVTLQGDQGSGGFQVTGSNQEGEFRLQAGAGEAAKVPEWVPRYPGAEVTGTYSMEQGQTATGGFQVTTDDAVDVVLEHYRQQLKGAGFTVSINTFAGDHGAQAGTLSAEEKASKRAVTVMVSQDNGRTSAMVGYSVER